MKAKRLLLLLLLVSLALLLVACNQKTVYYTVKFDSNGGTALQSIAIESGNTLNAPQNPELAGHAFLGWYYGETLWDFENNTVTDDITLKAKWELITYTVSFNSDGGTEVGEQTIALDSYVTKPNNPTRAGHTFKGWYSGNTAWDFEKMPVTKDITLTARWERITYTVAFDANGGNQTEPQTVAQGELATMPVNPTKQNHKFIGWYLGDLLWNFDTNRVTSDITLVAKWESTVVTHEVKFMYSESEPYVEPSHVVSGNKVNAPTEPTKQNYRFLGWYLENTLWDFENAVTSDIILIAKWEQVPTYEVKFMVDATLYGEPQHIPAGEKLTPPTPPSQQNQRFKGWYLGETLWDFENNTVTENITLVAKWESTTVTHEVTFMYSESEPYGEPSHVVDGNRVNAPTQPTKNNYRFLGWYLGDTLWNFENAVTESITLIAKWESTIVTHSVKFMFADGIIFDTRHIVAGEKLEAPTLTGVKAEKLIGWYLGDEEFDFENTPITQPITLTAKWEVEGYIITFNTLEGTPVAPQFVLECETIVPPHTTIPGAGTEYSIDSWTYDGVEWNFDDYPEHNMELVVVWAVDLPMHEF